MDTNSLNSRKIEIYYNKGISYINNGLGGGFRSTYIIPNVSVDEILLLLNNIWINGIGSITKKKSKDLNGRIYEIVGNEGNYKMTVIEIKNVTIIEVFGSC
ncbi:MAG: hypothetical protein ABI851_14280 [Saprospiraceae bacterium]